MKLHLGKVVQYKLTTIELINRVLIHSSIS